MVLAKQENANLTQYKSDPLGFVRQIISSVNLYVNFSKGCGNDGESNVAMDSLKKLTGEAFSLHYILLLAANLPKSLFDHFVSQLESFLFYYIFTKTPTKELERSFSVWADEIREITLIQDRSTQKNELNKFITDRFKQSMLKKTTELSDAMKRLTLYSTQRYRMRYLLARLTQYVDMVGFQGQKDCGSLDRYFKLEIEHILPDNPKDELRSLWQKNNPDLEYDEFKNRFGNLTLLEKPINIVVGNDFYAKKKPQYALSGNYLTRSITSLAEIGQNTSITRINEKLSSFDDWMAKDIEKRQALLIGLIHDIWKISEII